MAALRMSSGSGSTKGWHLPRRQTRHTKPFAFWQWHDREVQARDFRRDIPVGSLSTRPEGQGHEGRFDKFGLNQSYQRISPWRTGRPSSTAICRS